MWKLACALVAVAACEAPELPGPPPPRVAAPDPEVGPRLSAENAVAPDARPTRVVHAMHSDTVRAIAVTDDGKAAVSADASGGMRLWPALDGTREPVVVAARPAASLALVHGGHRYAIAAVDALGQLEVLTLEDSGELVARGEVKLARPLTEIHAAGGRFVGLRDDGWIVIVEADGTFRADVRPAPEEHVTTIAARRDAALAIVERAGKLRGRWLELATGGWGNATADLALDGAGVALSPDHRQLAATANGGRAVSIFDLATGRAVQSPVDHEFSDPQLRPAGFTGDGALAIVETGSVVTWWQDGNAERNDNSGLSHVAAVGDGVAVADEAGGLALYDGSTHASDPRRLGYRVTIPARRREVGRGWLVTDTRHVVAVGEHLDTLHAYELPAALVAERARDVRFVDEHHVLATSYIAGDNQLDLIDLDHRTSSKVAGDGGIVDFDERTGLLVYRVRDGLLFMRYASGGFGAAGKLPLDDRMSVHVAVRRPSGGGELAVVVTSPYGYGKPRTTATITRIRGVGSDGQLDLGEVSSRELDAAWWRNVGDLGTLVSPAPVAPVVAQWASPDGSAVGAIQDGRIVLRGKDGAVRWRVAARGATELAWRGPDTLIAIGAGMVRLDLGTGEATDRQCGWGFGLWTDPLDSGDALACEAF